MQKSSPWRNRSVFITGATGLLGSCLTRSLVDAGADVTILKRDEVGKSLLKTGGLESRINIVRGELEDYTLLLRALNEYQVDVIFHLGAQTQVEIANRNPLSTFETNIQGTWNILEAARENSTTLKAVLVASSDKAYGIQDSLPYDETFPLQGTHPYDVSKSCADLIARTYHYTYKLPVSVTRCGNLFGPGDLNFNRLVPGIIRNIYQSEPPQIRSNGKLLRDYLFVEDAAAAYLLLAEHMLQQERLGEAYNFSYGKPLSVIDMVNQILAIMNSPLQPVILNTATHEIPDQYLSSAKAIRELGWSPVVGFEEGLQKTIAWYTAFLDAEQRSTHIA